jgi:hypothetical protein
MTEEEEPFMKQTKETTAADDVTTTNTADEQEAEIGMGVIIAIIALIGLWAGVCLLSALSQFGIVQMAAGWLQAISGG